MTKQTTSKTPPVNLKEQNASHTFRVTIRDREHFYKIVKWLNENVGKGTEFWTMEGRVLKSLSEKDGIAFVTADHGNVEE